jgi:hypothetical protein
MSHVQQGRRAVHPAIAGRANILTFSIFQFFNFCKFCFMRKGGN